jgi:K+-transporting ATPase ATPase A chain
MPLKDILQLVLLFGLLILITPFAGTYMARVFSGDDHPMKAVLSWLENLVYRIARINPDKETTWTHYTFGLLMFNFTGIIFLFLIQIFQAYLPLNPAHLSSVSWHSALNTSISFVTNTNWQGYPGETTLSYLVQMAGLTVQNFLSAATGIAVLLVLIRGFSRKETALIGNFWVDITRTTIYILLPLSIFFAVIWSVRV